MTRALRWAAMRAILMFPNCEGQSRKTVSTDYNFCRERRAFWRERPRAEAPDSNRGPSGLPAPQLPLDHPGSHGIVEIYLSKNAFIAMKQYKNGQKIWREIDECHTQVHSVHTWPVLEYREHGIPSIHAATECDKLKHVQKLLLKQSFL